MRTIDVIRLLVLASLWGGSFIFMRIAAPVLGAIATAEVRVVIAALALSAYAWVLKSDLEIRTRWRQYLVIGFLNSALPFTLISWSEVRLTASMAAILNSTTPLFGTMVAAVWAKESLTAPKVLGIVLAFGGVSILVGWSPIRLDTMTVLALLASLAGALSYGIAGTFTKLNAKGASPMGLAVGSQVSASLFMSLALPFGWPARPPTSAAILSVVALALICTAVAYILFFRLLVDVGPTRTLTVTFLVPITGVLWGYLFIGEAVTVTKLAACAVILAGTSLVTGVVGARRTAPATA
ncbi:MAG TPA: DMT family transporter [Fimbriimonadaceae bacterium]|nr:DMT family transporter [Fimbriimonadaceae bacterium]